MASDVSSPQGHDGQQHPLACNSFSTAIAVVPPQALHSPINILRSAYDNPYPRWGPHVTVAIPFVAPEDLYLATEKLQNLFNSSELLDPWEITFSEVDTFQHQDSVTVYLKPDEYSTQRLRRIRNVLSEGFNLQAPSEQDQVYRPHLTIGQTASNDSVRYLKEKAEMLLHIRWTFESLLVLKKNEADGGKMELFAAIPGATLTVPPPTSARPPMPICYAYNILSKQHVPFQKAVSIFDVPEPPSQLTLATYNVLHSPLQPQDTSPSRLRLLLDIILDEPATMIILQEVTDVALRYFLSAPLLREKYPYASAPGHLPLPNLRNIVALSSIPFKAHYLSLLTPHKPALIMDIDGLTIAGVHLQAGLHEEKLAMKLKELSKLSKYLDSTGKPVIIAGDFNIPSVQREYTAALPKIHELLEGYADAWMEKPCADGDTFTPDTNRFAKKGAKVQHPQRHDRIYFTKNVGIQVEKTWTFGFPKKEEELASDHWGFGASLKIDLAQEATKGTSTDKEEVDVPQTTWKDKSLVKVLSDANLIPNAEHDESITNALTLLKSILEPMKQHFRFHVQVVGSFGLGCHTVGSDLDLMIISSISPKTFWQLLLQHIQQYKANDRDNRLKVLRVIKDARMPLLELLVDNCRTEIVHCVAPRLLAAYIPIPKDSLIMNRWKQIATLPQNSEIFQLPVHTLDVLMGYRDNIAVLAAVPNLKTFRLARRAFKHFCSSRGIYGSKYGYLGGFAVTFLIAATCKSLPSDSTASEILAATLSQYNAFPWEDKILWFPGVEKAAINREDREAMYIASISRPSHNITRNASRSTAETIEREFANAVGRLSTCKFGDLCNGGLENFFSEYKIFIKIQCAFWGPRTAEGRKWISWIESRLVLLLVNLRKEFEPLETRLWPARFGDPSSDDVQGTYLIGVSGSGIDEGVFRTVLRGSQSAMQREGEETGDRWVSVDLVKQKMVIAEKLQIDNRVWDGEEEIVLDDEEEEEEEDTDTTVRSVSKPAVNDVKYGKLRPSQDILNRLFWDSRYCSDDYVVGYEDRFKGVKEMNLTSWKKELSDEEFIPMHRVVYFREKGVEGNIVWDRRTRVDLIFGSGQRI
jgi:2'-5' RNA ligase/uncharacterized protein (UPF0248 family)